MSSDSADGLAARAAGGVRVLVARNLAGRVVGVLGGLALAGLLGPSAFGVFAVGISLLQVLQNLSTSGFGAGLLRRNEPPSRAELRALVGAQLLLSGCTLLVGAVVVGAATGFSRAPSTEISAVYLVLVSLPISAWRLAPALVLERELKYGAIARIELTDQIGFYAIALPVAALGGGIWALPAGALGATVAASLVAQQQYPLRLAPSLRLADIRGLWRFGAKFQLAHALSLVRDLGLGALLLFFAGSSTAGLWGLAQRFLLAPVVLVQSLWRVSFVAFGRIEQRVELQQWADRLLRGTALVCAVAFGMLVAVVPSLVEQVLGAEWQPASEALVIAAAGWVISAPISGAILGILQSRQMMRAPTASLVAQIAILWVAAALVAPGAGVVAVGAAWLAALLVDACLLARAGRCFVIVRYRPVMLGAGIATLAALAGNLAAARTDSWFAPVVAGVAGSVPLTVLAYAFARDEVRMTIRLIQPRLSSRR